MGTLPPRILATLTACSIMLAGIPLIGVACPGDPLAGACVSTVPYDTGAPGGSRGENSSAEREEEQQEDADPEIDLFAQPAAALDHEFGPDDAVTLTASPPAAASAAPVLSIRGPPAR